MKNQIIRVTCKDMTSEGYGVVDHNGFVLFVKGLLTKEEADVRVLSLQKKFGFAKIEKIWKTSSQRVESQCPVSYKCGGCDLRHLSYRGQLAFKENIVISSLKKAKLSLEVLPIIAAEVTDRYRNKVQVPVRDGIYGYYRKMSNDIVEEKSCLLQSEKGNLIIERAMQLCQQEKIDAYLRHLYYREAHVREEVMLGFVVKKDIASLLKKVVKSLCQQFPMLVSVMMSIHPKEDNVILGEKDVILFWKRFYRR